MYRITRGTGFQLELPNGFIVSVQFGPGTYSDHHHRMALGQPADPMEPWESETAEFAVWHSSDDASEMYQLAEYDNVKGWQGVSRLLELLEEVSKLEKGSPKDALLKREEE